MGYVAAVKKGVHGREDATEVGVKGNVQKGPRWCCKLGGVERWALCTGEVRAYEKK